MMAEGITIRWAQQADLEAVHQVEAACFPPAEAATRESLAERIAAFTASFLVAETEGKVIGFINGSVVNTPTISDEMFEDITLHQPHGRYQAIFGLDVLPDYRRQGIATRLMKALIAQAQAQGRSGVILTCKEHLIHYYETFGFINQGVSQSVHGGALWYDMILDF